MSDDLLDRLLVSEPPFTTTGSELRHRAATIRTRRRVWAGATAGVVAVAAVLAGTQALDRPDRPQPAVPEPRFDPDVLAADLTAIVATTPGAGAVETRAVDGSGTPLSAGDRSAALIWRAEADLGDDAYLRVALEHLSSSAARAEEHCAGELAEGMSLTCEVTQVDGSVVSSQVRPVHRTSRDDFLVPLGDRYDRLPVDRRWLQRRTIAYRPDGSSVTVNVFVRAPGLDTAAWPLTETEAVAISLREDLTFPDVSGPGRP